MITEIFDDYQRTTEFFDVDMFISDVVDDFNGLSTNVKDNDSKEIIKTMYLSMIMWWLRTDAGIKCFNSDAAAIIIMELGDQLKV